MERDVDSPHPRTPSAVTAIPGYTTLRQLGRGAGGEVWLAVPAEDGAADPTPIAVKVVDGDDTGRQVAALRREWQVGQGCSHPSLVDVLFLEDGVDRPHMGMTFVGGPTLAELAAPGEPLPEPRVRELGAQLGGALAALHAAGYVHGDIKPDNVRVDEQGRAVLLDLGFARPVDAAPIDLPGTLAFLAPEYLAGARGGAASDIFALGVVLYQLATARHPFGADDGQSSELLAAVATARVAPASRLVPSLSPFIDALLDACLRREPAERPSAGELAAALESGEGGAWWRARVESSLRAGIGAAATRAESHRLMFVGRKRELSALTRHYDQVLETGAARAVLLRGPVGIGKTRLVSDLVEGLRAGSNPCVFLYARCSDVTESHRYGTPLRLLEHWLQLPPHQPLGSRELGLLESLISPRDVEALAGASVGGDDAPVVGRVAVGLAAWLAALARSQPLVVLVDDLHRARAATLESLDRILEGTAGAPLLLILAWDDDQEPTEPTELERLADHVHRQTADGDSTPDLRPGPLTEIEVTELVTHHFHHATPRLRLGRVLHGRSHGNPGLVEELLTTLVERGGAAPDEDDPGRLRLNIAPDAIRLPGSLMANMRARYRELDPLRRRWLERLSVVGGRLDTEFLTRAFAPATAAEVDEALNDLARRGWLVTVGARFRFARGALREAVYRSLSEDRRVRLHRMAARALSLESDDRDSAYQRAYHLRAAGEHRALLQAVEELLPPAERRGSPHRLLRLARWGLEAIVALETPSSLRELEVALLESALMAADRLGERELQRRWLDRLADLADERAGDPGTMAAVYLLHGRHAVATGDFSTARGLMRHATTLAREAGDSRREVDALRGWALVEAEFASTAQARDLAAQALDAAVSAGQLARAHLISARIEVLDDRLERALDDVRAALKALRTAETDSPSIRAGAYLMRARVWRAAGGVQRALGSARRALALAREAGDRRREAETAARLGQLLLDADRPDDAEAQLREAKLLATEVEDRRAAVLTDLWLGLLLFEQEASGASGTLRSALLRAGELGYHRAEAVGHAILARHQLLNGSVDAARSEADRAYELESLYGLELNDRIVVEGTCALLLEQDGRQREARELRRTLRRRIQRTARRIRRPDLRQSQWNYALRLLEAVTTPDGPVYPRS